jgi:hypothetical protein
MKQEGRVKLSILILQRWRLFLVGILAASATSAGAEGSLADAENYIKASEAAWAQSSVRGDPVLVKQILADDFVGLDDGTLFDKKSAVADASKGAGEYVSNHLDYAHVRFFGDTAVVQGGETWTRKDGVQGRHVWMDTWVYRKGQWQVVAADDTTVAKN